MVAIFVGLWWAREPDPGIGDCPPLPTATLPSDPTDGRLFASHANDIVVGRVVDEVVGGAPVLPIPGDLPAVSIRHRIVEFRETEQGTATGTVVMYRAIERGVGGRRHRIHCDFFVEVGAIASFVTVRDRPTVNFHLCAGPDSRGPADAPFDGATPTLTVILPPTETPVQRPAIPPSEPTSSVASR